MATSTEVDKGAVCNSQLALSVEVKTILLPLLDMLKGTKSESLQATHLINLLELNLQNLDNVYGNSHNLAAIYQRFTPVERLVANMVRQGLPTKDIAAALAIAPGTVSIHRKHIRKKLELDGTATSLQSHLLLLS
jgi:DNA-binding NarL/FixJ family response regulator